MCWELVKVGGLIQVECEQQQVKHYCILVEKMDNVMRGCYYPVVNSTA